MPQTKTTRSKNTKKASATRTAAPEEEVKPLKPIVIDEDEALPVPEKLEEVSPFGEVPQEDDPEDDAGLDEEELNPFGDKWEV
mgnify:CR=1 FL=1